MSPLFAAFAILLPVAAIAAEPQTVQLTLQDHRFTPAEISVPSGVRIRLEVSNLDATAEEFDSDDLRAEKMIPAGRHGVVTVGPLAPGTYTFGGEYHPDTARGTVTATPASGS